MCALRGATVGCCAKGCLSNFHFMCARRADCVFMVDRQVFCANCTDSALGDVSVSLLNHRPTNYVKQLP